MKVTVRKSAHIALLILHWILIWELIYQELCYLSETELKKTKQKKH